MIAYLPWLIGRVSVIIFALITWAYCVSTYSPFAFDMFVRPRLFTWLETFVNWHHLFYAGAYVISLLTLLPEMRGTANRAARWAAAGFAVVFLAWGVFLVRSPYIRLLSTTTRGPLTAYVALLPLLWLAAIDVLAARSRLRDWTPGSRTLVLTTLAATAILWSFNFGHALIKEPSIRAGGLAMAAGAWSFTFDLLAYAILFVLLSLVSALARLVTRPGGAAFVLLLALLALGIEEFFRRLVFPSLAFADHDALPIAIAFGLTMSATIWALWLRSPEIKSRYLFAAALVVTPLVTFAFVDQVEHFDWDFLLQKSATLIEGLLIFVFARQLLDRMQPRELRAGSIVALPVIAVVLVAGVIRTSSSDAVHSRYTPVDPAFRLTVDAFLAQPARDTSYATELLAAAERSLQPLERMPSLDFVQAPPPAGHPRPNVFLFVIDGLRRDYLSPYNNAVTFTPGFDAWAKDALVFQNAFTKYGGTWLAMPSIWSGLPVRRGWSRGGFDQINALEKLIVANDYQFIINDFTVAGHLRPETKRTFIDPQIKSVDTDICANVAGIEPLLTGARPSFAFAAPMNVYVLNASHSPVVNGFSSGYAGNVSRVDRCFGQFITNLKASGLYDDSIIIVTSDHGESLGENGNYGHQFFLFPEDIRIPLIMSIPPRMRGSWTTDLGRIAFSFDIVPTLYRLLGYDVRDLGPLAGSPLVAAPGEDLVDRRRQPQLVVSSYGASFGMLSRNGKFLFISDLINYREYGFELFQQPLGTAVRVTDDLRRVNQARIRARARETEHFYQSP